MEAGVASEVLAGVPPLAPHKKVWLEELKKAEKVNDIEDLINKASDEHVHEDGIKKSTSRGRGRGCGRGGGRGRGRGRGQSDMGQKRGESSSPSLEQSKCKKSKTKNSSMFQNDSDDDAMTDVENKQSKNDFSLKMTTNKKDKVSKNKISSNDSLDDDLDVSLDDYQLYPNLPSFKSHEKTNLSIEQADIPMLHSTKGAAVSKTKLPSDKPSRLENEQLMKEKKIALNEESKAVNSKKDSEATSGGKEKLTKGVALPPGYGADQLAAVLVRVLEEKVRVSESHSERQLFRMTIHTLLCRGSGCKATENR